MTLLAFHRPPAAFGLPRPGLGAAAPGLAARRPVRRMPFLLRLRCFANRPAFRAQPCRAAWGLLANEFHAALADARHWAGIDPPFRAAHAGSRPLAGATAVAAFIHYAPRPEVSETVLRQVEALAANGFAVIFVSMAPALPLATLDRLLAMTAMVVQRRNYGLDFGGWRDVAPLLRSCLPGLRELLLVNDSLCGPLRPLAPIFGALRAAGTGLFGLTENLAPRPHLQSYFLLARGRSAIEDVLHFLEEYRPSASKRRTIRNGEIRLSAWMRSRGHRVAAWCSYAAVERAALRRAAARRRLRAVYPFLFRAVPEGAPDEAEAMAAALARRPVNPTHLFWRELVEEFDFPFVKTDLLLRNPLGVADPMDWPTLLRPGEGLGQGTLQAHLASVVAEARP